MNDNCFERSVYGKIGLRVHLTIKSKRTYRGVKINGNKLVGNGWLKISEMIASGLNAVFFLIPTRTS